MTGPVRVTTLQRTGWPPYSSRKFLINCQMGNDPIIHRVTTGLFYNRIQRYTSHRKVSIYFTFNFILKLTQMLNAFVQITPLLIKSYKQNIDDSKCNATLASDVR